VDPLLRVVNRDTRAIPLVIKALGAIGDARAVEPVCRLVSSQSAEVRREAVQALTTFNRLPDLPTDLRQLLVETLESVGVQADRTKIRPLEVRGGYGPEADRPAETRKRPAEESPTPSSEESKPAPRERVLNFQQLEPGIVLNERYRVVERIGGGGFGTVYLVEDVVVREELVLKILAPHLSLDSNMIRRFVQELRLTRRITHKNVIRIYDLLDLEGAHGISMEYFGGRDLGQVLRRDGTLPADRVARIVEQVLEGLAAAHELGIIHRDIKPANLLVGDDDTTKIVDFGLASVGQSTKSRLTASGILVGTPEYISPEQITGHKVDGRTDLYSLGAVMYEMLSGKPPFGGENAVNVLFQHLEANIPPVHEVMPGTPRALSDLIACAMDRAMDGRPASAAEMLERLRAAH
jgi:serine/threonine-protein kinase